MKLNGNAIAAMVYLSTLSTAGQVDGFRSTVLFTIAPGQPAPDAPIILQSDTGVVGGAVPLEALPGKTDSNTLKKVFTVKPGTLAEVNSAEIQLFAALRDPTDRNNFSFDVWEWIFFELNGHGWVLRVEDLPLHRRSLFGIDWNDVDWASISIPDVNYLREGQNELVIWNNNTPEKPREKYLVVAYDDSGQSAHSFFLVQDQWVSNDLNGEREGTPVGEWMMRLKLNRYPAEEQKHRDAVGAARFRQAVEEEKDFVWGFTDAVHKIFPDRPYTGPLENEWQIDAARNEYESCQLVLIPVSVDMRMVEVWPGDFTDEDGATIPASATTVRVVMTALVNNREWPDPLPEAFPVDIPRGQVQAFWITVLMPDDSPAGVYKSELTITSMSAGGKEGQSTKVPLGLRVRDFAVPTLSRYQMVAPGGSETRPYHIANCSSHGMHPGPRAYLDGQENLRVEFDKFDQEVEQALAEGVTNFSMGLAYTGAGNFAPWTFDWRVPIEGQDEVRRISVCPVNPKNAADDSVKYQQSRKWFKQFLSQVYNHLEEKGWTPYYWVYGADEPHRSEWVEPLTRYFALIKEVAPKLRIMITKGPTDEYGPNIDIVCIMMNHLREDTVKLARNFKQKLWCYSCGDLNNPALTIPHPAITVRLWHWLQEKWSVERVLLWHTGVYGKNFLHAGVDRRGDGQVFWQRCGPEEHWQWFPSIRAEMLRDSIEDREYFNLLKELTAELTRKPEKNAAEQELLSRAERLAEVPDDLVSTQFKMVRDVSQLLAHRAQMAEAIEELQRVLREKK